MTIPAVTNDRKRFHIAIGGCSLYTQYAAIYLSRLKISHSRLENQARCRWPELPIRSVPDVKVDEECIIIGNVFRVSRANFFLFTFGFAYNSVLSANKNHL